MGNGGLIALHRQEEGAHEEEIIYDAPKDDAMREKKKLREKRQSICKNSAAAGKSIARGIRITGALGKFSSKINDSFVATGLKYNERVLYKSLTQRDIWLRFTTKGTWMVSNTEQKDENLLAGFCCCRENGHLDPSYAQGWYVSGIEGVFRTQARVKAKAINPAVQNTRPDLSAVKIEGAAGPNAQKINGVYRRQKNTNQKKKRSHECLPFL